MAISESKSDITSISTKAILGLNNDARNILGFVEDRSVIYGSGSSACVFNILTKDHKILPIVQHHGNTSHITCLTVSVSTGLIYIGEYSSPIAVLTILEPNTFKRKKSFTIPELNSNTISLLSVASDDRSIAIVGGQPDHNLILFSFEKSGKVATLVKISSLFSWPSCNVTDALMCPTDPSFVLISVCPESGSGAMGALRMFKLTDNQFRAVSINTSGTSYNFTCASWVLNEKVIAGTAGGKLVFFETFEHGRLVSLPHNLVNCSAVGVQRLSNGFLSSFSNGMIYLFQRVEIGDDTTPFSCTLELIPPNKSFGNSPVVSMRVNAAEDAVVVSNSDQQIFFLSLNALPSDDKSAHQINESKVKDESDYVERVKIVEMKHLISEFHSVGQVSSEGSDSAPKQSGILDIDTAYWKPLAVTCGNDKFVRIWNYDDFSLLISMHFEEESMPTTCSFHPSGFFIVVACIDKIRILSVLLNELYPTRDIHIRAASQVRFSNGGNLIAACQSNVIYLIDFYELDSMTTLRGHNSRVRAIMWSNKDKNLVSVSTDGNIMTWNTMNGQALKQINCCRITVSNACLSFDEKSIVLISSNGQMKQLNMEETATGTIIEPRELPISLPCSGQIKFISDSEFVIGSHGSISTIKKNSSGQYDQLSTVLHNVSISSICLSKSRKHIICGDRQGSLSFSHLTSNQATVAQTSKSKSQSNEMTSKSKTNDAEELSNELLISLGLMGQMSSSDASNEVTVDEILVSRLQSYHRMQDIAELHKRVDELSRNNEYQLKKKDDEFEERINDLTLNFDKDLHSQVTLYDHLSEDKKRLQVEYASKLNGLSHDQEHSLSKLQENYDKKIRNESGRYEKLRSEKNSLLQEWDDERQVRIDSHVKALHKLTADYDGKVEIEENAQGTQREKIGLHMSESDQYKRLLEEDVNNEIASFLADYNGKIDAEENSIRQLTHEHQETLERFNSSIKTIDDQKQLIARLKGDELRLIDSIRTSERDIQTYKREIREREEAISEKERKVIELKNKNQELEKFKFVLDYKIRELKRQIDPREVDITNSKNQLDEMNEELGQYSQSQVSLQLMETELGMKLQAMNHEHQSYITQINQSSEQFASIRRHVMECLKNLHDYKTLKSMIVRLFKKYCEQEGSSSIESAMSEEEARKRSRDQLERNLEALTKNQHLGSKMFTREVNRMTREQDELIEDMNNLKKEARRIENQYSAVEYVIGSHGSPEDVKIVLGDISTTKTDSKISAENLSATPGKSMSPLKSNRRSGGGTKSRNRTARLTANSNNGFDELEPWKELNRLKGIVESLQEEVTVLCNQMGEDPTEFMRDQFGDVPSLRDAQIFLPPLSGPK